jgi:hypothetical protein
VAGGGTALTSLSKIQRLRLRADGDRRTRSVTVAATAMGAALSTALAVVLATGGQPASVSPRPASDQSAPAAQPPAGPSQYGLSHSRHTRSRTGNHADTGTLTPPAQAPTPTPNGTSDTGSGAS